MKDGIRSMGATWMPQYNDTASCLDACINSFDNCFAVDVDSRSRLGKFCWVHSNVTALNVVYRAHDIKQYTVKAVCKQPGYYLCLYSIYINRGQLDIVARVCARAEDKPKRGEVAWSAIA
jgi:hypothetical protein